MREGIHPNYYQAKLRLVDVLISSIVNMVLSRKVRNQVEVIEISTFFLCNEKLNVTRKIS